MTEQLQIGKRVLIVDDERAIREMVCLALSSEGYQRLEASDAHKAEAVIREQQPEVILLDWMMPGISGIDFARSLRNKDETRHIPIIMLTARVEEDDMVRGLDNCSCIVLPSPIHGLVPPRHLYLHVHHTKMMNLVHFLN